MKDVVTQAIDNLNKSAKRAEKLISALSEEKNRYFFMIPFFIFD